VCLPVTGSDEENVNESQEFKDKKEKHNNYLFSITISSFPERITLAFSTHPEKDKETI